MKRALTLLLPCISLVVTSAVAAPAPGGSTSNPDTCGYPSSGSSFPYASVVFNESTALQGGGLNSLNTEIVAWYGDEHALTLGVSTVNKKASNGTTSLYTGTVAPLTSSFSATGSPVAVGVENQYAFDGSGRPMWPVLYVTNLTGCSGVAGCTAGDWQSGHGFPYAPTAVYGTWKSAVSLWDTTKTPNVITITPGADPTKNNWTHIPDVPAGGFGIFTNEGYGAEIVWNIASLGLTPGDSYRFQFMVHDGDQNQTGGDVGERCTTLTIPVTCPKTTGDSPAIQLVENTSSTCVCPSGTLGAGTVPTTVGHSGMTYCFSTGG